MSTMFKKPVRINQILTTSLEEAKALEDPVRIAMLDMLSNKPMSIADLVNELRKRGVEKAPTTIRHHLEVLKKADLVDLTMVVDVKGGVLKYYSSKAKFLGHYAPDDFDQRLADAISKAKETINSLVKKILREDGDKITEVAEKIKPCPHCGTQDFMEYVILTLLNRAIVEVVRTGDFKGVPKMSG